MKVRAAVMERVGGPIEVQELDLQGPQEGEVLVRVRAVGVCHSDWHLVTGDTQHPLPVVLGHEGAGVIEEVGANVEGLAAGDLVSLNWAPNCGACFYCTHGRPSLCAEYVGPIWQGTMIDGTTRYTRDGRPIFHYSALACFAEKCVVPAVCCVKMQRDIPPEIAAVIGCAVTTGVGSVFNTAKVEAGSSVLVIGAGGVGLSTIMGAVSAKASNIIACDPLDSRRESACEVGADSVLERVDPDEIKRHTEGRGTDYVFECVGTPELQELAVKSARPGGTIIFSGLSPSGSATNIPGARLVREEKTVMGSYYGTADTARDFPRYAQMYKDGQLPLDKLVSHRYSLDQINEAYQDMLSGKSTRGVVVFD